MRAVDRWVRGAFFGFFFAALSFSRFGGESRPAHTQVTQAVGRLTKASCKALLKTWYSREKVYER
jgi:hypothetical protein